MVVSVLCAFGCEVASRRFQCIAILFTFIVVDVNLYCRNVSMSILLRLYPHKVEVQRAI